MAITSLQNLLPPKKALENLLWEKAPDRQQLFSAQQGDVPNWALQLVDRSRRFASRTPTDTSGTSNLLWAADILSTQLTSYWNSTCLPVLEELGNCWLIFTKVFAHSSHCCLDEWNPCTKCAQKRQVKFFGMPWSGYKRHVDSFHADRATRATPSVHVFCDLPKSLCE